MRVARRNRDGFMGAEDARCWGRSKRTNRWDEIRSWVQPQCELDRAATRRQHRGTMTRSSLAFAFAALTTTAIAGENFLVYFGTNTNAKNGSKGIYVARFNTATGELTQPELAAEAGNPGFLAIHPSKKFLYASSDVTGADGKKAGGISAFSIDKATGKLTPINQAATAGGGPCHVNVDKTGKLATIANYGSGSVGSFAIKEDGSVSPEVSFFQHEGSGADPKRQAAR